MHFIFQRSDACLQFFFYVDLRVCYFYCTVYNEQRKQNESMQKKYKTVLSKVNIAERVTSLREGLLSLSALCYTCFRKWRQIGLSTII